MSPGNDRDDARLIERVRELWSPAPMTPARRAAFDAGLQERLDRARRGRLPWPALGGLVAASLAALVLLRTETTQPPAPSVPVAASVPTAEETTLSAADLLYSSSDDELDADDAALPSEYAAIAGVFLDF